MSKKDEYELEVELARTLPEPVSKRNYTITKAEMIQTKVRGYKGVRVHLKDDEGNEYATMLWLREIVGDTSKLGAFLNTLGKNIKEWEGKRIRIEEWTERKRVIKAL